MTAAGLLEADAKTPRKQPPTDFYDKLKQNKETFVSATSEAVAETTVRRSGRDSATTLWKMLKAAQDFRPYTDDQKTYYQIVMQRLTEGTLPRQTIKTALQALKKECQSGSPPPLKTIALLESTIPGTLLNNHFVESTAQTSAPKEVILSEYLIAD